MLNHKNQSVRVHDFAMAPRADIPRSSFRIQTSHKTTFDAGWLIPVYVDEILPGDTFHLQMTAFARLATPLYPVMDNMYIDTFFFFVPSRIVWANFKKFMGEQQNPGDSISYVIPTVTTSAADNTLTLYDYMGIPTKVAGLVLNSLPFRAYNLIWNEWFRDENLQNWAGPNTYNGDGPDVEASFNLLRRGKRHDYFTSALPFLQKGSAVTLPLGTSAPVVPSAKLVFADALSGGNTRDVRFGAGNAVIYGGAALAPTDAFYRSGLSVDLSTATAATINQIRQSFQIQKLLERDARGGTRYTELVYSHFGVTSPDARLQRPEYLGGNSSPINFNAIAQTAYAASTPLGRLAAAATGLSRSGFHQSFTEHGYVIGMVSVRADLSYQQGLRKMWSKSTRYDFYWPVFSALGEQAILNREIFAQGTATDALVFGYQERWAEYRYNPALVTGLFRSTYIAPLDAWHLAQEFSVVPTLNNTFIEENPPVDRVVAAGGGAAGQQLLLDAFFDIKAARPLPMYSVPGLVDHF